MLKAMATIEELQKGLAHASSIAGKFSSIPMLINVLVEASGGRITLTATDLEVTFQSSYEADVIEEGAIAVPAKLLSRVINSLSGATVTLEERDNLLLRVRTENYHSDLFGVSPENYPKTHGAGDVTFTEFPGADIVDSINKTIYSVAIGNTNFNLAGIFWLKKKEGESEVLRLVSTDNSRLNIATLATDNLEAFLLDEGVLVSSKGLTELKSLSDSSARVSMGVTANTLVAKTEDSLLIMRLLEGKFPNYEILIPKEDSHSVVINRKELTESIKQASPFFEGKVRVVFLKIAEDSLNISSKNSELGMVEKTLAVSHQGPPLSFGLDPRYLLDALDTLKSENVTLSIINSKRPIVLTGDKDPGYLGIITITSPPDED